ncbi:MAG: chromosomal replication initiator DnaA [Alphaproteobacteria bacterium]|nr:chromosomal replication initiator DnaA [Alphaproteobacteria bacterium]
MTRLIQASEVAGAEALDPIRGLRHLPPTNQAADRAADRVLALVSARNGVSTALMLHPSRCRAPIARARQLAMYLMHTLFGCTMTEVGRYFGRDRTTVAHACGRIEDERDDRAFDAEVSAIECSLLASATAPCSGETGACHVR